MLYRFLQGQVCTPSDLTKPPVWRGVARRLAEWHALIPTVLPDSNLHLRNDDEVVSIRKAPSKNKVLEAQINAITPGKLTPNIWTVMQKWILALPTQSDGEKAHQERLQVELERTVKEVSAIPDVGHDGFVFSHCDLLSGNVIIHTHQDSCAQVHPPPPTAAVKVSFIDYEYAVPAPAAFDIANHFSEWGGFECDYTVLPTKSTRRAFLSEYLESSYRNKPAPSPTGEGKIAEAKMSVDALYDAVDRYRGVPGLYWGIWALIQAQISQIDFDYAGYAEIRLAEYWDWREVESDREVGLKRSLRERRWAEE
jgi:ethanolamine kinase